MLDFWSHIPWLRSRSELHEEAAPGLPVGQVVGPGMFSGALGLPVLASAPDANVAAVLDGVTLPAAGNANPFHFSNDQRLLPTRFAGDRGLLLPRFAPPLFPHRESSGLLGLELQELGGELQPDAYLPSVRMGGVGSIPDHIDTTPLLDDPTNFPWLPQDRVREAPDQIVRTDAAGESKPVSVFDRLNFNPVFPRADVGIDRNIFSTNDGAFDPRFITPVQGQVPVRPPPNIPRPSPSPPQPSPGLRHNNPPGPPPNALPSAPSAPSPQATPRGALSRPSSGAEPPPNTAGPAAAAEQRSERLQPERPPHPLPRAAEAWQGIAKAIYEDAPGNQYEGTDGIETAVGIRLNPRLPLPAAGVDYDPVHPHLRRAFMGELQLGNRIVGALPEEIVLHYGMPAGLHGPDVSSLNTEGDVSLWDSKFRSSPRSIGGGMAAHQSRISLDAALSVVEEQIMNAVAAGRIPPELGNKALENVRNGNVFINTVGTGSAHGAVVRCVRNKEFVDCWSN